MKQIFIKFCGVILILVGLNCSGTYPIFFSQEGDGKFKVLDWNESQFDRTTIEHFIGSGLLTATGDYAYRELNVNNSLYYAVATSTVLGSVKEWLDGYREGFGVRDFAANTAGNTVAAITISMLRKRLKNKKQPVVAIFPHGKSYFFFISIPL